MKTYWLVCYTFFYINLEQISCSHRGNSAHALESIGFLPGQVAKALETESLKIVQKELEPNSNPYIVIESFAEITEDGYNDFLNHGAGGFTVNQQYCISGRKFRHENKTSVTVTV